MAQEIQYSVVNGPSKFDLMTALFEGRMEGRVSFGLHRIGFGMWNPHEARIIGVERHPKRDFDRGEIWIVKGYIKILDQEAPFSGLYSTDDQRGVFKVTVE